MAYNKKGELDLAMQDFEQAIKLDPKYVGAFVNRARANFDKGEYDLAMRDYNEQFSLPRRSPRRGTDAAGYVRYMAICKRRWRIATRRFRLAPNYAAAFDSAALPI
ncbi:MAG: tetratricopeptide repeat protein [Xanthobacteraceae bacterium]